MSAQTVIIHGQDDRTRAAKACLAASQGVAIVFREAKRSDEQNRLFHALCDELAANVKHAGGYWPAEKWKEALIVALWGYDMMPSLTDDGTVLPIRRSSARLSVKDMSELIEFTYMVGAKHDYVFTDLRPGDPCAEQSKPKGKADGAHADTQNRGKSAGKGRGRQKAEGSVPARGDGAGSGTSRDPERQAEEADSEPV